MPKKPFVRGTDVRHLSALTWPAKPILMKLQLLVLSSCTAARNAVLMNNSYLPRGRMIRCLSRALLGFALSGQVLAQTQIVNCDAPVQSRKRGLGVNSLSDLDFRALAPGVSWYYNWGATPLAKPADVAMDFLPMAWNGDSSFQT